MIRLIVFPRPEHPGVFNASLEGGVEVVSNSRQPLSDGCRELIKRGIDPEALIVLRHAGLPYDATEPRQIGWWAQWTYKDGNGVRVAPKRALWKPFPGDRSRNSEHLELGSNCDEGIGVRPLPCTPTAFPATSFNIETSFNGAQHQ